MPEAQRPDVESRIRAEIDRAVAPYEGKVPPFMVAKLRELAERYWRENPEASRILHLIEHKHVIRSGVTATAESEVPEIAARARKE